MEIPFENCNLARIRSLSPRGIYVTTTVVISFHPYFLTKTDRAYRIQCLYLEAEKLVTANLGVHDPPNLSQLQTPPMPSCHYEVYRFLFLEFPLNTAAAKSFGRKGEPNLASDVISFSLAAHRTTTPCWSLSDSY